MSNDILGFSQRLKEILADKGVAEWGRQRFLAKKFGVAHPSAKRWLDGTGYPETAKLIAIAEWGNTTIDWLLTGRGLKHPVNQNNPDFAKIVDMLSEASEEQISTSRALIAVLFNKNS